MGHNLDLHSLLGAPIKIKCPRCNWEHFNNWDDEDIECGNPNHGPGAWSLRYYCEHCKTNYVAEFTLKPKIKLRVDET